MLYSHSRLSWVLSEIGAAKPDGARLLREAPAAFGRLRVETANEEATPIGLFPAAFGRLRVETITRIGLLGLSQPAAFGRLRVETWSEWDISPGLEPAAFGRLRVETVYSLVHDDMPAIQLPSGGCVLKPHYMEEVGQKANQLPSGGCVLKHLILNIILQT